MPREGLKWQTHKSQSTDVRHRGGPARSSEEGAVMAVERRGWITLPNESVNQQWEELMNKEKPFGAE